MGIRSNERTPKWIFFATECLPLTPQTHPTSHGTQLMPHLCFMPCKQKHKPNGKLNVPLEWVHSGHRGRRAWIQTLGLRLQGPRCAMLMFTPVERSSRQHTAESCLNSLLGWCQSMVSVTSPVANTTATQCRNNNRQQQQKACSLFLWCFYLSLPLTSSQQRVHSTQYNLLNASGFMLLVKQGGVSI